MLLQVLTRTPPWVFVLLVALLWLGLRQMAPRTLTLGRAAVVPLAMAGLSFYGVIAAFKDTPVALLAWLAGVVAVAVLAVWGPTGVTRHLPALTQRGARYDGARRQFHLPGSVLPLVLFMGIFCTKFIVGATLATQPALHLNLTFALSASTLYGVFSGFFLTRGVALLRLVLAKDDAHPAIALNPAV